MTSNPSTVNGGAGSAGAVASRVIVGLEIHVELATRSKMWTAAPNVAHPDYYEAEPNSLCDPVVVGMPGTLPVMNRRAVEMSMLVGMALGCRISSFTKWDRKSYYYPDLPKNYQISQYDLPLCEEGALEIPLTDDPDGPTKTVRIIRAHLEEDAGKLLHEAPGGIPIDHSIVDLNRAGTPLLEIVTYPDLASADETVRFCQALRDICRHLGVSEGVMQRGHMRFEPNINVEIEQKGQTFRTPIVEIKNLNSFKAVHGAVLYEHQRQVEAWLEIRQAMSPGSKSTRGWDDVRQVTVLQREKEEAHDYRYFPDPDLVPLVPDEAWVEQVRATLPPPPLEQRRRLVVDLGLSPTDAGNLVDDPRVCRYYGQVLDTGADPRRAAALLLNTAAKCANERGCRVDELGVTPAQIKAILDLVEAKKISSNAADTLFTHCADSDEAPERLAEQHGLLQVSDASALEGFVESVLADAKNARIVEDIRGGKDKAVGALLGQVMKLSKGQANPQMVGQMILEKVRGFRG